MDLISGRLQTLWKNENWIFYELKELKKEFNFSQHQKARREMVKMVVCTPSTRTCVMSPMSLVPRTRETNWKSACAMIATGVFAARMKIIARTILLVKLLRHEPTPMGHSLSASRSTKRRKVSRESKTRLQMLQNSSFFSVRTIWGKNWIASFVTFINFYMLVSWK